jgi:hypothetical protein
MEPVYLKNPEKCELNQKTHTFETTRLCVRTDPIGLKSLVASSTLNGLFGRCPGQSTRLSPLFINL